jgi:hypothetical protein
MHSSSHSLKWRGNVSCAHHRIRSLIIWQLVTPVPWAYLLAVRMQPHSGYQNVGLLRSNGVPTEDVSSVIRAQLTFLLSECGAPWSKSWPDRGQGKTQHCCTLHLNSFTAEKNLRGPTAQQRRVQQRRRLLTDLSDAMLLRTSLTAVLMAVHPWTAVPAWRTVHVPP